MSVTANLMQSNTTRAESEIRSLLLRERCYKDACQWENLRNCYHPDPTKTWINISWYTGDIDGLICGAQRLTARGILHQATPVRIDIHGSKALAESLCNISVRYEEDEVEYDVVSLVRCISQLEHVYTSIGGAWKMLTMEVIYIRDNVVPVVPLAGPCNLNFDSVKNARKSYRYLTWHVAKHGGKIRDDFPGEDDEQSVREVMDRNQKWLETS